MWTKDEFDGFFLLLEEGWPGEFGDAQRTAWEVMLADSEPGSVVAGLKRLMLAGRTFRPSISELLGEVRSDPSTPTFEEAFRLIFGKGGALRAQPKGPWGSEAQRLAAQDRAALERAQELHPLVASFLQRQSVPYLRSLALEDPTYGDIRRKELREAWERHLEANEGREVAALASGDRRGLRNFDPLAALGVSPKELPSGD